MTAHIASSAIFQRQHMRRYLGLFQIGNIMASVNNSTGKLFLINLIALIEKEGREVPK